MLSTARKLPPALAEQVRALCGSAAAQAAVPAPQEAAARAGGFLSKLFGGSSSRLAVPLSEALPGVQLPTPVAPPSSPPRTESTTLPNGVKIVSEATYGPTATVGIFVDSGSVYETPGTTGASHLLEYLAFKSTQHRTHFRLVREMEGMGANVVASASREQMMYSVDVVRSNAAEAVEVLADAVLNPALHGWEVAEAAERLRGDLRKYRDNHQNLLTEGLHTVGFSGALARPLVCPEEAIAALTPAALETFLADNYTAGRLVVAGAGLAHRELVSLAEPLFAGLPAGGAAEQAPASKYVGGDFRLPSTGPLTHTALAFEFAGGWRDLKGSVAVTVLQFLLGGGGSFSAGGPGKGMHSRLYTRVLSNHHWVSDCRAFSSLYNDTGLVGLVASLDSDRAGAGVDVLIGELQALKQEVPKAELERAKNGAISQVLINLESRAVVAEDIGRQVLTYGHRKPVGEFLAAIRAVKPADIAALVTKLLKTPVTYAAHGDIANMPRHDEVAARFK